MKHQKRNPLDLPRNLRTTHARSILDGEPIAIEWDQVLARAIEDGDQPIARVAKATVYGAVELLAFACCAAAFTAFLALLAA